MKGITTHVMVIIFSLIIMVVLLVIGIGFVQNYTNIPFEKLWDLTPTSSIATEPVYTPGDGGGSASDIKATHFFSSDPDHIGSDLSEIACNIGTDIYNDFSANGNQKSRDVQYSLHYVSSPSWWGGLIGLGGGNNYWFYLVGKGSFLYNNTQYPASTYGQTIHGYVTGTNTTQNDNIFATVSQDYAACHICREPESVGVLKSGLPNFVAGIKDLDEICINMQLRDRKAYGSSTPNFCSGTFNVGGTDYQFGNCVGWDLGGSGGEDRNNELIKTANTPNNWQHWDNGNCAELSPSFCNNNKDLIRWVATVNASSNSWEAMEKSGSSENNVKLMDGYKYIYGVWWDTSQSPPQYTISFTLIPNENNIPTFNSFSTIGNYFSNWRINPTGNFYKDARTAAIFDVSLSGSLSINQLREDIGSRDSRGKDAVTCSSCDNPPSVDEPGLHTISDCTGTHTKITLWTNATVQNGYNGDLPSGTYKVIVRSWYDNDASGQCIYDRSAILYKIG